MYVANMKCQWRVHAYDIHEVIVLGWHQLDGWLDRRVVRDGCELGEAFIQQWIDWLMIWQSALCRMFTLWRGEVLVAHWRSTEDFSEYLFEFTYLRKRIKRFEAEVSMEWNRIMYTNIEIVVFSYCQTFFTKKLFESHGSFSRKFLPTFRSLGVGR